MSQTVPDCTRFTFLNQLRRIDSVRTCSSLVLWVLVFSGLKPAQANPPQQADGRQPADLDQVEAGLIQQQLVSAPASSARTAPSIFVRPPSSSLGASSRATVRDTLPNLPLLPAAPMTIAGNTSNSGWTSVPSTQQGDCTSSKTCNYIEFVASPQVPPLFPLGATSIKTWQQQLQAGATAWGAFNTSTSVAGLPASPQIQTPQAVAVTPLPQPNPPGKNSTAPLSPTLAVRQPPELSPTQAPLPVPSTPVPLSKTPSRKFAPPGNVPTPSQNALPIRVPQAVAVTTPTNTWQQQLQSGGGVNGYNPAIGQPPSLPPLPTPQALTVTTPANTWQQQLQSGGGVNGYNPATGQPPSLPPLPTPQAIANTTPTNTWQQLQSGGGVMNGYNPAIGQPPSSPPLPAPQAVANTTPINTWQQLPAGGQGVVMNGSNPIGQLPALPQPQTPPPLPLPLTPIPPPIAPPNQNITPPIQSAPPINQGTVTTQQQVPLGRPQIVSSSALQLQGVALYQGDDFSARARVGAVYPLTPRLLFGATVDLTDGNAFADSPTEGLSLNELYLATSIENLPNLRFVIGQLDLTSYFDRNSFAKDGASQFFNFVFQTNPALSATGISSRPGVLVNWSVTDNIEFKAAAFASSRDLGDFAIDGAALELGVRYGNAIIRGTYAFDRDAGSDTGFQEIFQIDRGNGRTGPRDGDREEAYGVNAEVFVPNLNLGLFGRYGRYDNREIDEGGDTYSFGATLYDLFTKDDRLGLAYGQNLSNDKLRRRSDDRRPDVLELYYDFRFLPSLRLAFSLQERNEFTETILGVRVKTEFNVAPIDALFR